MGTQTRSSKAKMDKLVADSDSSSSVMSLSDNEVSLGRESGDAEEDSDAGTPQDASDCKLSACIPPFCRSPLSAPNCSFSFAK